MRRLLIAFGLLLAAASPAAAAPPPAAAPIAALNAGLVDVMKAGKSAPFVQRYQTMRPLVQNAFDLDAILGITIGPRWQAVPADQKHALNAEFLRFTVASYVANFSSYDGEQFTIDPTTRPVGSEQVVATHIVQGGADKARIDYVMRQTDDGWRAVDVLLDGTISQDAVQRSDFRSQFDSGPDALLTTLTKKVAALSGGANIP